MYKKYAAINRLVIMLADILLIEMSYCITMLIRFGFQIPAETLEAYLSISPWINVLSLMSFYIFDLYTNWMKRDWLHVLARIAASVGIATVLTMSALYLGQNTGMPRSVTLLNVITEFLMLGLFRSALWTAHFKKERKKKVLVIGESREELQDAAKNFREISNSRFMLSDRQLVTNSQELKSIFEDTNIDVVALKSQLLRQPGILQNCLEAKKEILIIPDVLTIFFKTARLQAVDDKLLFDLNIYRVSSIKKNIKRIFDFTFSLAALILLSPLFLIFAILIPLTSPGPVFYRQERLGEGNRKFNIIKFRSMINNAETMTGPTLALVKDPRVTELGAFLRKYRLDELPQLINVLKGEMSVVGPRPEREYFAKKFIEDIPFYRYRMTMKPGITGLAQVMGKYGSSVEAKLRYDLMYTSSYSLLLDLRIILETIRAMLQKDNAAGVERSNQPEMSNPIYTEKTE